MQASRAQHVAILTFLLIIGLGASRTFADEHLYGVVTGRGADGSLLVRGDDSTNMVVVMSESTKVRQANGLRTRRVDVPSLIPGLRVDVEGKTESATRFIAESVKFTRSDLKMALAIRGGVNPTDLAVEANRALIEANQQAIRQQSERVSQNQAAIEQHERRIAASDEKIIATSGAAEAANGRIANLDDYNVVETMTVYFPNNRASVRKQFQTQLQQLAQRAKAVDGYKVQVEGYASAVGPLSNNQMLSKQRADAVAAALQQGGVAPANMLVPAAMGISDQVAPNTTREGQAKNRRTVVRVIQNRGITGQ
jgi:outer membrane protein OmpA-like peptidoglycan-associated protein